MCVNQDQHPITPGHLDSIRSFDRLIQPIIIYLSQKQMPRIMKSRLVIIECADNIFWQLFLKRLYNI